MGTKSKKPKEAPLAVELEITEIVKTDGQKTSEYKITQITIITAAIVALALGTLAILALFGVLTQEQAEALENIIPPMIGAIVLLTAGIFGAGMYSISRGIAKTNGNTRPK